MKHQLLIERLDERLKAMGLSDRKASLNAKVNPDSIRNIRRGSAPRAATLEALAKALKVPTAYFSEALAEADSEDKQARMSLRSVIPLTTVFVRGYVQAGVSREAVQWPAADWYAMTVPETRLFPGITRYGLEVRGSSMNRLYPDGSVVVVVNYSDIGRTPIPGEKVICVIRSVTGEYEATIKEYQRDEQGRHILWPRSDDPDFQTPIVLRAGNVPLGDSIQLPSVVHAGWRQHAAGEGDVTIQALVVQSVRDEV